MTSKQSCKLPTFKWASFLCVLAMLCACSDEQQALADTQGDVQASSLTFYSKTPADDQPVVTAMDIVDIACDISPETIRTRIDLGEEGHILVHDERRGSDYFLIVVDLARFDIMGGKREHIYPARDDAHLVLEPNGDAQGRYQFQLHGDYQGMYLVEMDIRCPGSSG